MKKLFVVLMLVFGMMLASVCGEENIVGGYGEELFGIERSEGSEMVFGLDEKCYGEELS